jgi:membrane protein
VAIVAAGVAFFSLLAIFPLITACLSIYGYFADPSQVQGLLRNVNSVLPQDAWEILNRQITAVISAPGGKLGLGIAVGLLIALWSAGAGIRAIMRAMNIAYGERETRNLATFYALAASMTLSMIVFVWIALAVIIGVPAILHLLKLDGAVAIFSRFLPWVLLVSMFGFAAGVLYRFGPSRRPAKKRWVFPGIVFTTVTWLLISFGFSKFVAAFGNYNAIYGSLSAVIILLIWFWLTAYTVIVGAEINAEMERHTTVDTTRGPDRPLGERGAAMADYVHNISDAEFTHSG